MNEALNQCVHDIRGLKGHVGRVAVWCREGWYAPAVNEALPPPIAGRYELVSLLGQGSFGRSSPGACARPSCDGCPKADGGATQLRFAA